MAPGSPATINLLPSQTDSFAAHPVMTAFTMTLPCASR
jgi:hypothetical protein